MAKKQQKSTVSRKQRQAQLDAAKKRRNTQYMGIGLLAIILIAGGILFTSTRSSASNYAGELAGVQIDGDPNAPIQLVEYADFGCPACRQWHTLRVKERLKGIYGDQIAFTFRHFPIITPNSPLAAQASQCAAEQDMFWDYHDHIYENSPQAALAKSDLTRYAADIGLDTAAFGECVDSNRYADHVNADNNAARRAGARATPSFFLNGEPVNPQPDALIAAIDQMLENQ